MPYDNRPDAPKRIAVIGGGISGLAAAYGLADQHQVTVFEAEPRFGGHARTVRAGARGDVAVDTGFIVFNYVNYPHLTALFRDLDVPVKRSDMSFGVSLNNGRLEYALRSLDALFGQRRNALNPRFILMIRDILRFNAKAYDHAAGQPELTIGALLTEMRMGAAFRDHYLYPICSAIWSTPRNGIADFPAEALLRFMRNHGLMQSRGRHGWWTVYGGSNVYVQRLVQNLRNRGVQLQASAPVAGVWRKPEGVSLRVIGGEAQSFDHVIFACHADQALRLLADADDLERRALGAVKFQNNRAFLHCDPVVMPRQKRCWSSWIYRDAGPDAPETGVTYWMNRLQSLPDSDPLFVSLNPSDAIDPRKIYDEHVFRHPVFDHAALKAQNEIAAMQGRRDTWFAGAWLRNGFHEDGFASAKRITRRLGRGLIANSDMVA